MTTEEMCSKKKTRYKNLLVPGGGVHVKMEGHRWRDVKKMKLRDVGEGGRRS